MHQIKRAKQWVTNHKVVSIIILLVLIFAGYQIFKSDGNTETSYVLGTAKQGALISSVTGTGQVSTSNQIDLKSKTSNTLIYLNAKVGQVVKKGTLIAKVDPGNSGYELESQKIAYDKLVAIDPNDLRQAENTYEQALTTLNDSYISARGTLTTTSTNLADVLTGLDDLLTGYLGSGNNSRISQSARDAIRNAKTFYYEADKNNSQWSKDNRKLSAQTSQPEIERLLDEANQTALAISQATKAAQDAVVYLKDNEEVGGSEADLAYTSVTSLVAQANSELSSILSAKNSINNNKLSLDDARAALDDLKDGPDTTDLRSAALALKQKQDTYNDYFIRAPFAGQIASVLVSLGDEVSSGTPIVTLISQQQIANISLNEIDAAKVQAGQKATLILDAVDDLSIAGEVLSIDLVGTVSQGVVSYNSKIGFDTTDARVKSGMSVSADIIIANKSGVLTVPNGAVKDGVTGSYVEMLNLDGTPKRVPVKTGLSNDTETEIVSGLEEGDSIIVRTVASGTTPTKTAPSLFGGGTGRQVQTGGLR